MADLPDRRRSGLPETVPLRVLLVDDDSRFRAWVAALVRRLNGTVDECDDGQAALELLEKTAYDVAIVDQEMPRRTGIEVVADIHTRGSRPNFMIMLTAHDGMEAKLAALHAGFDDFLPKSASQDEIVARLTVARRIATRQRMMHVEIGELYGLAMRDELTGLFNRRFFLSEMERALRDGETVHAVLFDVDAFKSVNDTFGHLAGDTVLRDIAAFFQRTTRPQDVVARYGGDELVMLVCGLDVQEAETIAERLVSGVAELEWRSNGDRFRVGLTFGIASSTSFATVTELLDAADRGLYRKKRSPRAVSAVLKTAPHSFSVL